ncbi:MAG: hypothetical protein M3R59_02045 [Verrucomicrobiota bacterium]|nr:hypothetical protein [Verrucomicrobiota bacterium]
MRRLLLCLLIASALTACSSTEPAAEPRAGVAGEAVTHDTSFAPKGMSPGVSW